jgi:hypothetical protein
MLLRQLKLHVCRSAAYAHNSRTAHKEVMLLYVSQNRECRCLWLWEPVPAAALTEGVMPEVDVHCSRTHACDPRNLM